MTEEIRFEMPHMLREIHEQPEALRETLRRHWVASEGIRFDRSSIAPETLIECRRILIAASGASRHAGLFAQAVIEELAGIPVDVEYAGEYCNRLVANGQDSLAVLVTQSGETGDTTAAQRVARQAGYRSIAITNVIGSTVAREADAVMYTYAGKERAIPATKSFLSQLAALYLLGLMLARLNHRHNDSTLFRYASQLAEIADLLEQAVPKIECAARTLASRFHDRNDWILLGRGVHFAVALEGALKLKETAYVRAEGFPAGEFRHGPQAILDGSQVVVGVVGYDPADRPSCERHRKTLDVLDEIKDMSGTLILIASDGDAEAESRTENIISVPNASEFMLALLEAVALQLLAYHVARNRNLDVDNPRNLVKSVEAD